MNRSSNIPVIYESPTTNVLIQCPPIRQYVFSSIVKHIEAHRPVSDIDGFELANSVVAEHILTRPALIAYTMDSVLETISSLIVEVINTNNDKRSISAEKKARVPPVVVQAITDATDGILEDTLTDEYTRGNLYDLFSYTLITTIITVAVNSYSEILPMIYGQIYSATTQRNALLEDVKIVCNDSVTLINLTIVENTIN